MNSFLLKTEQLLNVFLYDDQKQIMLQKILSFIFFLMLVNKIEKKTNQNIREYH